MVASGDRLDWGAGPIVDKHCVGGLPGNRTTPIVVAIVAACGLTIPKTSSRAITSPAGTADVMETMAPVDLDLPAMRRVVEREGGCVVWGGAVRLSPIDDTLIRVERALDIDSEGQLVASVLSKKAAAGSTHLVVDLPVGPTAKVRTDADAERLEGALTVVATSLGIRLSCIRTDGRQPVGRGIGPALEARDVLAVLQKRPDAPPDLRARSLALAGALLEMAGSAAAGTGVAIAGNVLGSQTRGIELKHVERVAITGNTIYDSEDLSLLAEDCSGLAIGSNTFVWRGDDKAPPRDGLKFVRCRDASLIGLVARRLCHGTPESGAAITLENCHDFAISECQLLDSLVRGIELIDCQRCRISGNSVIDRREQPLMRQAIRIRGKSRDNLVVNNLLGGATEDLLDVAEGTATLQGNMLL